MPTTIVVGGQYGSEGKGKLSAYLALRGLVDVAVRCGGPNAGHSFTIEGKTQIVRQVPACVANPSARLLMAPGALIDPSVLLEEIDRFGLDEGRLGIDPYAAVISPSHRAKEKTLKLRERISSTLSGTGAATASKIIRDQNLKLAKDMPKLRPFLVDVAAELNTAYDQSRKILVEGTQGFGLSLHHSRRFPFVTSRDTSASNFMSEVGLSPLCAEEIIMVVRTFPIRVSGESGSLEAEVSWAEITKTSRAPTQIEEYTSVTNRLRRVGLFEPEEIKRAAMINRPTRLALHGVDYLDFRDRGKHAFTELSDKSKAFILELEALTNVPVSFIFTGPQVFEIIDRCESKAEVKTLAAVCGR